MVEHAETLDHAPVAASGVERAENLRCDPPTQDGLALGRIAREGKECDPSLFLVEPDNVRLARDEQRGERGELRLVTDERHGGPVALLAQRFDDLGRPAFRLECLAPLGRGPAGFLVQDLGGVPGSGVRAREDELDLGDDPAQPAGCAPEPLLALGRERPLGIVGPAARVPGLRNRVADEEDVDQAAPAPPSRPAPAATDGMTAGQAGRCTASSVCSAFQAFPFVREYADGNRALSFSPVRR